MTRSCCLGVVLYGGDARGLIYRPFISLFRRQAEAVQSRTSIVISIGKDLAVYGSVNSNG